MHACASAGIIYLCLWFKNSERRDLLLGCALLALNCWIRTEGIVCCGRTTAGSHQGLSDETATSAFAAGRLLPIVIFMIYAATNGLTAESVVIAHQLLGPLQGASHCGRRRIPYRRLALLWLYVPAPTRRNGNRHQICHQGARRTPGTVRHRVNHPTLFPHSLPY